MSNKKFLFIVILLWIPGVLCTGTLVGNFNNFGARARQTEAKANLSHIYMLQRVFFEDNKRFGAIKQGGCGETEEIGLKWEDCSRLRYEYSLESVTTSGFIAVAREKSSPDGRKVFPRCTGTLDEWQIDQDKNLRARHDAGKNCDARELRNVLPPVRDLVAATIVLLIFGVLLGLADLLPGFFLLKKGDRLRVPTRLAAVTAPLLPIGMLLSSSIISFMSSAGIEAPGLVLIALWAILLTVRAALISYYASTPRLPILLAAGLPTIVLILTMVPGL